MTLKEDKEFGEYFAGTQRLLPNSEYYEQNTDDERKLIQAIHWHTSGNPLKEKETEKIQQLLKSGEYSDIFVEPKANYVYRGMFISRNIFEEEFSKHRENQFANFIFKPRYSRKSSSWSKDVKIAKQFAGTSSEERSQTVSVILIAKLSDNQNKFWDLTKWYKQIDDTYQHEHEVVGLGDINVERLVLNNSKIDI